MTPHLRKSERAEAESSAAPAPAARTDDPSENEAAGILTIDLAAVQSNWRRLATYVLPAECGAVVKADAYGCGLEAIVPALARAGCKTFFVAHLAEARRLRAVQRDAVIYVLNGLAPGSAPAFAAIGARPVISSLVELAEWDAFCTAHGWRGGAALHFDTGMNRLGLAPEEAPALAMRVRQADHGITLVMSHLACADTPQHPLNTRQIQLFREIKILFRGIPASLANSAGIFLSPATHCELVRPGLALYGANPVPSSPNPMQPVVELKARIVQVRDVARGAGVGYGATWTAPRPSRIAIVSVGYADGYLYAASGPDGKAGAQAIIAGQRCPIVGRVSMDLLALDVTALPGGAVRRGDWATLIGEGLSVDDVARASGTISYEVLSRLGHRYHRIWKS